MTVDAVAGTIRSGAQEVIVDLNNLRRDKGAADQVLGKIGTLARSVSFRE